VSGKTFEIIVAQTAGFCMGVQRAVRMALDAADDPRHPAPIRTHGPLIHNRQVLQVLEQRGVRVMREAVEGEKGTVVVRAHGLPRREQQRLREDWPSLLDATCPHVRRVQRIVEDYAGQGYMCIVVGDRGHAEVEGVLSYADSAGHVVSGPQEVDALPDAERVVVVAQTTQDEDLFRRTVQRARERYGSCQAFETICRSTAKRQEEVRALAGQVEAMIVVGGLDSANTRRLAEISAACGTPTYHVETEAQLDLEPLLRCSKVGLTAGASTPNWMIKRVIRRLEDEHRRRSNLAAFLLRSLLRRLVDADVYAAGAAAALTYAGMHLLPLGPLPQGLLMVLAFCFVLGQHLLNQYVRRQSLYLSEPCRADFFLAHQGELLLLAAVSAGVALAVAFLMGPGVFALALAGTLAGLMYQVRLPRALGRRLRFGSLEQIPGSKELFVGLACASLAVLVPAIGGRLPASDWPGAAAAFAALFAMACQRTLALDLIGAESDQLVGREMLAGYLGPNRAERLYFMLSAFIIVVLLAAGTLQWLTGLSFALSICALYGLAGYVVVRRRGIEGEWAEALIDGQLYLAGLAALAWTALAGIR
jgi:(E)-4-hydroxy-3-methyl-but-2-enyl pyrophosphate reductase